MVSEAEWQITKNNVESIHSITLPTVSAEFAGIGDVSVRAVHKRINRGKLDSVHITFPGYHFTLFPGNSIEESQLKLETGNPAKIINFNEEDTFESSYARKLQAIRLLQLVLKAKPNASLQMNVGVLFDELKRVNNVTEHAPAWLECLTGLKRAGLIKDFHPAPEIYYTRNGGSHFMPLVRVTPALGVDHELIKKVLDLRHYPQGASEQYYVEVDDALEYAKIHAHQILNAPLPKSKFARALHKLALIKDKTLYKLGNNSENDHAIFKIYARAINQRLRNLKNASK